MSKESQTASAAGKRVYSAPALEKGLDILELLSRHGMPMTFPAIVQALGRSTGELFRMMQVLEMRGFVVQSKAGYALTSRLFEVGMGQPSLRGLVETALPAMREVATATAQSCHLSLMSGADIVVVARMESPQQVGFSVRVGFRRAFHLTGSGMILYAFQPEAVRAQMETLIAPKPKKAELADLRETAERMRVEGYVAQPSTMVDGIVDIAAPILRGDRAAAALAMPYLPVRDHPLDRDAVIARLRQGAKAVSDALLDGDWRA